MFKKALADDKVVGGDKVICKTTFEKLLQIDGHVRQVQKTLKELAALQIELSHYLCEEPAYDRRNVLSEITNVEIMIHQLKLIFDFTDEELLSAKVQKIAKLEMMMGDNINE